MLVRNVEGNPKIVHHRGLVEVWSNHRVAYEKVRWDKNSGVAGSYMQYKSSASMPATIAVSVVTPTRYA